MVTLRSNDLFVLSKEGRVLSVMDCYTMIYVDHINIRVIDEDGEDRTSDFKTVAWVEGRKSLEEAGITPEEWEKDAA